MSGLSMSLSSKKTDGRQVTKEGWLMKEGGATGKKWQNRWFRLQGKTVNYYTKKEDSSPQGVVHLDDVKDVSKIGDRSGKSHCIAMVIAKDKGKKVYYLAADNSDILNEWFVAFNVNLAPDVPAKLLKYSTAEIFHSQGIRITGDVNYEILSFISHRVPIEKKKRDNFGWFCDRPIAVGTVLNLFSDYGWLPEKIYRSTALSGSEPNVVLPVVRIIFSKSPIDKNRPVISPQSSPRLGTSRAESSGRFLGAIRGAAGKLSGLGKGEDVSSSSPPATPILPEASLLEGADDELISLMQEFDIPLSLLEISAE